MTSIRWYAHNLAFALALPQVHPADLTIDGRWQLRGTRDSTWVFIGHHRPFDLRVERLYQVVCPCAVHEPREQVGRELPLVVGGA